MRRKVLWKIALKTVDRSTHATLIQHNWRMTDSCKKLEDTVFAQSFSQFSLDVWLGRLLKTYYHRIATWSVADKRFFLRVNLFSRCVRHGIASISFAFAVIVLLALVGANFVSLPPIDIFPYASIVIWKKIILNVKVYVVMFIYAWISVNETVLQSHT